MVVSAGLSPAWQQVLVFDGFRAGEVNRAAEAYWCASGKVLNVAVALHSLAGDRTGQSMAVSTLGGTAYASIDAEFEHLGIARKWIRTASPTRVCTTVVDRGSGVVTELVENAGPISDAELKGFFHEFSDAASQASAVVLTGSLPAGAPTDFFSRLLGAVSGPAVLDVRGPELLAALEKRPAVVKPNRAELAATLGKPICSQRDLRAAMLELLRRGARAVVTTAGADSVWLAADGEFRQYTPSPVERPVNPIGCGDCVAAGMAWALAQGGPMGEAVEQGMALAHANLRTLLPSDFDGRRQRRAAR